MARDPIETEEHLRMLVEYHSGVSACMVDPRAVLALFERIDVLERAIQSTRDSLTETARREVHIYLTCELAEPAAADIWHQLALEPQIEGRDSATGGRD